MQYVLLSPEAGDSAQGLSERGVVGLAGGFQVSHHSAALGKLVPRCWELQLLQLSCQTLFSPGFIWHKSSHMVLWWIMGAWGVAVL